MRKPPAAFMSYVHFDDQHEGGQLSEFRERLAGEVHVQTTSWSASAGSAAAT